MLNKKILKKIGIVGSIFAVVAAVTVGVTHNKSKASGNETIKFDVSAAAMDKPSDKIKTDAVYKTEFFSKPSTKYDNGLATLSVVMTLASSSTAESYSQYGEDFVDVAYTYYDDPDPATARNVDLVNAYKSMGFENDVYYKYKTSLNDASDTSAYGIATKKIKIDGKGYNLVNVTIRSASYGAEWGSNFMVKNEKGFTGFENAAVELYDNLKEYLYKNKLNKSNTKIWMTGLSRGGAVANISGAYLDRACRDNVLKLKRDNIYVYSFATPQGVLDNEINDIHNTLYDNLISVLISTDIVPRTIPASWGYGRYGKVYTINQVHISSKDLEKIAQGKKVDYRDETVELVKNISRTYNECRYYYDKDYDMDTLYKGFAVKEDFRDALDIAFGIFGDDNKEYVARWQKCVTEMVPFAISQVKKYDINTKTWVSYESLAEYISTNYDNDCINKAIEAGVFSQAEYTENMQKIEAFYRKGMLDKDTYLVLKKIADTYYGVRILAVHYNVDLQLIKNASDRFFDRFWALVKRCMPIGDTLNFKKNHFGEYYMAWLKNYDPSTRKVITQE